jgi:hypothetical protein
MSDWKKDLDDFMAKKESEKAEKEKLVVEKRAKGERFVVEMLVPALEEVKAELEKHGRMVNVSSSPDSASISVYFNKVRELSLTINYHLGTDETFKNKARGGDFRAKGTLGGYPNLSAETVTQDELINAVISRYKDRL